MATPSEKFQALVTFLLTLLGATVESSKEMMDAAVQYVKNVCITGTKAIKEKIGAAVQYVSGLFITGAKAIKDLIVSGIGLITSVAAVLTKAYNEVDYVAIAVRVYQNMWRIYTEMVDVGLLGLPRCLLVLGFVWGTIALTALSIVAYLFSLLVARAHVQLPDGSNEPDLLEIGL